MRDPGGVSVVLPDGSGEERRIQVNAWLEKLRFLWEEESAPPPEAPRGDRQEPAGVPRALQKATRLALAGVLATSLMGEIIGVRLVASVDAAPSYTSRCIQMRCTRTTGQARLACYRFCVMKAP
jgi:hypothetical protein